MIRVPEAGHDNKPMLDDPFCLCQPRPIAAEPVFRRFDQDGYVVLPGLLDGAFTRSLRGAIDALCADITAYPDRWHDEVMYQRECLASQLDHLQGRDLEEAWTQIYVIGNLSRHVPAIRHLLLSPRLLGIAEAADWLARVFGFTIRLRMGGHRVQLGYGQGGLVVFEGGGSEAGGLTHRVMVRVADVDAHHRRAVAEGATVTSALRTYPYGERQYSAIDPGGHAWTFSQSVVDVDPASWGADGVDDATGG